MSCTSRSALQKCGENIFGCMRRGDMKNVKGPYIICFSKGDRTLVYNNIIHQNWRVFKTKKLINKPTSIFYPIYCETRIIRLHKLIVWNSTCSLITIYIYRCLFFVICYYRCYYRFVFRYSLLSIDIRYYRFVSRYSLLSVLLSMLLSMLDGWRLKLKWLSLSASKPFYIESRFSFFYKDTLFIRT